MEDEYGKMDSSGETYKVSNFLLESGKVLKNVEVKYRTWGKLNSNRDNALVVCHALTEMLRLTLGGVICLGQAYHSIQKSTMLFVQTCLVLVMEPLDRRQSTRKQMWPTKEISRM